MRAIDTNVAARFILNDDAKQSLIAAATLADGALIPHSVLLELGWLLSSRYRQPRHAVVDALLALIDLPSVEVVDATLVRWAIARYARGADLADMIHIIAARDAGSFASFETDLGKFAGPESPLAIETLT